MAGIWVHGEIAGDGSLAKLSTEVATLARAIAAETGGAEVVGIVIGSKPSAAADELARFVEGPDRHRAHDRGSRRRHDRRSTAGGTHRGASARHRHDRRGSGGSGPRGCPVGADRLGRARQRHGVRPAADGPVATRIRCSAASSSPSALSDRKGIVTVRPNSVTAEPADSAGTVEDAIATGDLAQPTVPVVERLPAEPRPPRSTTRIIVAGGGRERSDGFGLIEELAAALGGAVGATRRRSILAGFPIASRSARPARSSSRSSIWRWASAAPSSTRSACRLRRRSLQ